VDNSLDSALEPYDVPKLARRKLGSDRINAVLMK
jgi:hypothetical protein